MYKFATDITLLRKTLNLNQNRFAALLKVEQGTVSRWESGKSKPTAAMKTLLQDIALENSLVPIDFDSISKEHVRQISGKPGAHHEFVTKFPTGAIRLDAKGAVEMPILGKVNAGSWLDVEDSQQFEDVHPTILFVPDDRYPVENQFALEVVGDSMNRLIHAGSLAICVNIYGIQHDFPSLGDIVVVERLKYDGHMKETTIKRFDSDNGKHVLVPESFNEVHKPIYPDEEKEAGTEIRIVAKVINALAGGF